VNVVRELLYAANMDNDLVVDIERRAVPRNRRGPMSPEQLARGLGWLSLGLGIAELLAPRTIGRLTGVPIPPTLARLYGAREIACGIGLLTQDEPTPWVQARVAGDALDLATVAAGVLVPGAPRRRVAIAAALVAAVAAVDLYCTHKLLERGKRSPPRHVRASIDVARSRDEIYRFWRNLANLPRIMPHLDSVQVLDDIHSHWVAKGPAGARVEWDAEIIDDVPNERLAWRTVEGSRIYNAGSVALHAAGAGSTRVSVELLYDPPGGSLGLTVARFFGRGPDRAVHADLRAFKELLESGEFSSDPAS
jgi:uncharacterized membrane protein